MSSGITGTTATVERQNNTSSNSTVVASNTTALAGVILLPGQILEVQNLATAALYLLRQPAGATGACTTSSFNIIAPACANAADGTSPPFYIDNWVGLISFAPATGTVSFIYSILSNG